ncbi:hypothetical protein LZ480_15870 [Solibacillus sp. MA9]|uniref:DUF3221 domain-containing protein n=1 Tax=Solibacillus palustris TaxID=2908203 RepID=A0ABS9UGI1_9BACL|nr:hypothetical protein [Solibacillus sp. MA9]MCH7323353.1 hypothetical protein [Solibacillus sp. MA9]
MKKAITISLIFISIILSGCNSINLSDAEFTNVTPAEIKMDNITYLLTDEVLTTNEVEDQIGKVTQIQVLVSYSEDQNPFKNPSKIFKVKDRSVEKAIAIQVNDKLYLANIDESF